MDDPSSESSESSDLAIVGIGGRPREGLRGSQRNEPFTTGSGGANFLSDHWLDLLPATLGPLSESSSGVVGAGESVEEDEEEYA